MRGDEDITVLHVDDDEEFLSVAIELLERADDRLVVEAEPEPTAALDRVDEVDADCVVADYEMPGLDGLELLAAVRDARPDLPFVLFTGKGSEEIADEAISAGVTDYVRKGGGNRYDLLANSIRNAVEAQRTRDRLTRRSRAIEAATEGIAILNADGECIFVNEAHAELYDFDNPAELEGETWQNLYEDEWEQHLEMEAMGELGMQGEWSGEAVGRRAGADGETFRQTLSLSVMDDGCMVCVVREL
jgi:DNA-binding NtrC family response regulator